MKNTARAEKWKNPIWISGKKLKVIAIGIAVRLIGVGLIVLGDGHPSLWTKAIVVAGVILSMAGIGVLRFLLFQPLFKKFGSKTKTTPS